MRIKNASRWSDAGIRGYAVATIGIIAAYGLNYGLHSIVGHVFPLMSFTLVAIISTCFYGIGPAIYAMSLGFPIWFYFFAAPYNTFDGPTMRDTILFVSNLSVSVVCMFLFERLRRSQYATALLAKVADSRYRLLVESDRELFRVRRSMEKSGGDLVHAKAGSKALQDERE
jgi:K+-sensing histidine kinase KdpD